MKIAILSDIHDNIWNLDKAVSMLVKEKCEAVIFCGDLCAPFTAEILVKSNLPTYVVWGNADEDHWAIVKRGGDKLVATPLAQEFGEIILSKKKIAFCHYPKLGELLAKTKYYDAVFHGHTHRTYQKQIGKTILSNPGAVCGIVGGKDGPATFMIYNTLDNTLILKNIAEWTKKKNLPA